MEYFYRPVLLRVIT